MFKFKHFLFNGTLAKPSCVSPQHLLIELEPFLEGKSNLDEAMSLGNFAFEATRPKGRLRSQVAETRIALAKSLPLPLRPRSKHSDVAIRRHLVKNCAFTVGFGNLFRGNFQLDWPATGRIEALIQDWVWFANTHHRRQSVATDRKPGRIWVEIDSCVSRWLIVAQVEESPAGTRFHNRSMHRQVTCIQASLAAELLPVQATLLLLWVIEGAQRGCRISFRPL